MFDCKACGTCCRNLDKNEIYKDLDRGDGSCIYLKNNRCTIYENRPLLCRIDESYEEIFYKIMTRDEYYKLNKEACKRLNKEEE